jgi:protein subunit release factor B
MPISSQKTSKLEERMKLLGIFESDIEEQFVRSSGPGGQKVNKASTCVVLKHKPTGIVVKCEKERSQSINRFLARRILVEKIQKNILGEKTEEEKRIWKIKKQKKKRSRRAKLKMLEYKKIRREKKEARQSIKPSDNFS